MFISVDAFFSVNQEIKLRAPTQPCRGFL